MQSTKRVGIPHLSKLKPLNFLDFIRYTEENNGIISNDNATSSLKMDGFGLRFGLNGDNRFFIESSNSGPIYHHGAFSAWTWAKHKRTDDISRSYDEIFEYLENYTPLIELLKKQNTNKGTKVIAECLYNPIGLVDHEKIKFVSIDYDLTKLGKTATIVILRVEDGDAEELNSSLIHNIKSLTNNQYLFTDPITDIAEVDLTEDILRVKHIIETYEDFYDIVVSRKHKDRANKKYIISALQKIQKDISTKLLQAVLSAKFSNFFEGIVIQMLNGLKFKVISDDFDNNNKYDPRRVL